MSSTVKITSFITAVVVLFIAPPFPVHSFDCVIGVKALGGSGLGLRYPLSVIPCFGGGVSASTKPLPFLCTSIFIDYEMSISSAYGTVPGISYTATTFAHTLQFGMDAAFLFAGSWHAGAGVVYSLGIASSTTMTTNGVSYTVPAVFGHGNFGALALIGYSVRLTERLEIPIEVSMLFHLTSPLTIDIGASLGVRFHLAFDGTNAAEEDRRALEDENRFEEGVRLIREKKFSEAMKCWNSIDASSSRYTAAQEHVKRAQAEAKEFYHPDNVIGHAKKLEGKDKAEAIRLLEEALIYYPGDSEIQMLLKIMRSRNFIILE
ncbi:MAG: hypothetical protein AABZ39_12275 [Spirochaetota bacterium]